MLSLRVHHAALQGTWRATNNTLCCGDSILAPYPHPSLAVRALDDGGRLGLCILESYDAVPKPPLFIERCTEATYDAQKERLRDHPADSLWLELNRAKGNLIISAGYAGAAPLYLAQQDGNLLASWCFKDVAKSVRHGKSLDWEMAAGYLMGHLAYCSRTLVEKIFRLTERSEASWQGTTLQLTHPPSAAQQSPRQLRVGVNVAERYRLVLHEIMQRTLASSGTHCGLELSGGLDSGTLAVAGYREGQRPRTYGLEVEGHARTQQQLRRDDFIRRTGARDTTLNAACHGPLSDVSKGCWLGPHTEIYAAAFDELFAQAQHDNVRLMFNGVGGDELLLPHFCERELYPELVTTTVQPQPVPDFFEPLTESVFSRTFSELGHAPRTVVPRSTLLSLAARAPVFLRRGIWPVSPFASREIIRFCRQLPEHWRRQKRLHRSLITAAGCQPTTAHPACSENFHDVLVGALRGPASEMLRDLFSSPRLTETGFVNGKQLAKSYDTFIKTGHLQGPERFYEVAALELTLRGALGW